MNSAFLLQTFYCFFVFSSFLTAQSRFEYTHRQMGTQIGLIFYHDDEVKADSVAQLVFKRIDELNATLSNYLSNSEINDLGKRFDENVTVSNDLFRLLEISSEYAQKTNGAFDVTLGPLIELWKKARNDKKVPSSKEIALALKKTGNGNLVFSADNSIKLRHEGMQLDVGGIGKGFAADEAIAMLKQNGVHAALVDMGGDVTVSDPPPNKEYWTLGFGYFDKNGKEVFEKLKLRNQAVATSGDLYQYAVIGGKRYSHIIDPKNGIALNNNIQVTTIAPNGTMADAYASAISVLGISEGKEVVLKTIGLEVFMVEDVPEEYHQWASSGFLGYIIEE